MTEKPLFIDWSAIYQVMIDCGWIKELDDELMEDSDD